MKSKKTRIALTTLILFVLDTVITYFVFNVTGSKITVMKSICFGGIPMVLIYWVLIFAGIIHYDDQKGMDKDCPTE